MNRLPVRFPPAQEHSWPGYLLLLLQKNGLRDYKRLFALLGINDEPPRDARNWSDELLSILVPRLANALEVKAEALWTLVERHHDSNWFDVLFQVADIRIAPPRICLKCCAEHNNAFDWRWQLPVFRRCIEHGSELHCHCPRCRSPFTWRGEVLTRCPSCKVEWSELDHSSSELCKNEVTLWYLLEHSKVSGVSLMKDVIHAMLALARPFDTLSQRLQVWPTLAEQNNLTRDAHKLLSNPALLAIWKEDCVKHRSELALLGNDAMYAPALQWEELHSTTTEIHLNHSDSISLTEYAEFIKPSRTKLISENRIEQSRYHVDRAGLASLVKLRSDDLLPLVSRNLLQPLNNTPMARDQLFDARLLTNLLWVAEDNNAVVMTQVTRASPALRHHLASYGDLLASLVAREIRGGIKQMSDWKIAVVNQSDYQQWLKQHFKKQCNDHQTISNAASALGVSPQKIPLFVKEGHLHWASWQRGRELVDGTSLWQFWCKQNCTLQR